MSTLQYCGSLSLGQCVPMALTAVAGMTAGLNAALPQLQAKLAGFARVSATLTVKFPELDALIAAATKTLQALQALLASPGPTAGLSLTAVTQIVGELTLQVGAIQAQLEVAAGFSAVLATPGIEAYVYDGTVGALPPAASSEFTNGLRIGGGPNLPIHAVLLVATDGGASAAMRKVLVG